MGEGGQRKFQFPFLAFFVSLSTSVGEKYNYFSYASEGEERALDNYFQVVPGE